MLDKAQRLLAAVGPQRGAAVHGDGRDGGGGAARGAGPPHHPYGGRPAGRGRAGDRDRRGAARRSRRGRSAIPKRSAFRRCAGASRAPMPNGTVSTSIRRASSSPPARRPDSFWRFSPLSRRAIASPWRCRAIRPIAISSPRSAASRSWIETDAQTRWSITGEALLAQHRARPLKGVIVGSPANPTGTMMTRAGARRADPVRRRCRHRCHLGRDLSRPRLCLRRRERRAPVGRRHRHQFVLQIFLHDRMADRLDGGAAVAGARGRAVAAESRDLGADAVADRRRSGVRRAAPSWTRSSTATRRTGAFCSRDCRAPGSIHFCRSTARSISMPTFRASRPTVSPSPRACWRRRASRRRPASISIRCAAGISCACATPARADEMHEAVERIGGWLKDGPGSNRVKA